MSRLALLLLACGSAWAASPSAAELVKTVRDAGFDPEQCYRVRDLDFQKEDIKTYFTDGYLIFAKPVNGEPRAALFTTDVEGGDAEVILLPPQRGERQSLAQFTQSANLDEHFSEALMIFTDGTGKALLDRVSAEGAARKVPQMGQLLADKWNPVLSNIGRGFEMRVVSDLLTGSPESGLLFFALSGKKLGNFDVVYDPLVRDQITAGQLAERNGKFGYSIWTNFASRGARSSKSKRPDAGFTMTSFHINAALDTDLRMKATTRVTVEIGTKDRRVFPLDITHAMHVNAVRVDGMPAELFSEESLRGQALSGSSNDVFLVVTPELLAAGSKHEFEFDHEGAVITPAGRDVYYVAARATWYPRGGESFATYDLTFRYPKRLTLVTAGDMAEDRIDGDWRVTRWRTPVPIRTAGFNLGEYEKVSGTVPGFAVDVYGNRHLETALQPKPRTLSPPSPIDPRGSLGNRFPRGNPTLNATINLPDVPTSPDPLARLRAVSESVSSALQFFTASFGAPAMKSLTIAPIPGTFGEGFPGLVYLSTLSYLDPAELPAAMRSRQQQLFFTDLIEAHEVAHQWWGNVVITDAYQDEWLSEALANYSALLWIEKRKGPKALETVLADYRDHLLSKNAEGKTVESAGPIVWGNRLEAAGGAEAWRTITYEKGAWVLHMLRRKMGDAQFLKMLAELRKRYEFRPITTEDFRDLAKEFRPAKTSTSTIDEFFDNWVYSSGVPELKLKSTIKGLRVSGTVTQSGVDDDFSAEIPVEIQFAKGAPQIVWVRTANEAVPFSATAKQIPLRVVLPPAGVLAK